MNQVVVHLNQSSVFASCRTALDLVADLVGSPNRLPTVREGFPSEFPRWQFLDRFTDLQDPETEKLFGEVYDALVLSLPVGIQERFSESDFEGTAALGTVGIGVAMAIHYLFVRDYKGLEGGPQVSIWVSFVGTFAGIGTLMYLVNTAEDPPKFKRAICSAADFCVRVPFDFVYRAAKKWYLARARTKRVDAVCREAYDTFPIENRPSYSEFKARFLDLVALLKANIEKENLASTLKPK